MHLASPALWKKSEVLIPWLFLGRWCVVERKHWNPEATVAAVGLAGMAGLGHGVLSCVGCVKIDSGPGGKVRRVIVGNDVCAFSSQTYCLFKDPGSRFNSAQLVLLPESRVLQVI